MVAPYLVFLFLLVVERILELVLSRRNAAWSFARGGIEYGAEHFRYMKLLHSVFLAACAIEVLALERPFIPVLGGTMFVLALFAQVLRYWAIGTLGPRWNVRVIVVPGLPAVRTGPYRFLRHPNYLAVVIEGFAVPLVHTAWWTATAFSLLNAWMLSIRIRCENEALETHCS